MDNESCCTCARLLKDVLPEYDEKSEKPTGHDRRLDCCSRVICGNCIANNRRFATYCPFCQVASLPNPLPQGLREPPSYTVASSSNNSSELPSYSDTLPSYNSLPNALTPPPEKDARVTEDVLHFLDHEQDTVTSLSFRYGVPADALRKKNHITSDHLLLARRTVLIPSEFCKGGVSLSPRPVDGEEEERRKVIVRKWMVTCKVSDIAPIDRYDVALLYLKEAEYNLQAAVETYQDDERWEKEHPIGDNIKGKRFEHNIGRRRFTGQR